MSFDEIPENREEIYPCPLCNRGDVTKNKEGNWECDSCDFISVIVKKYDTPKKICKILEDNLSQDELNKFHDKLLKHMQDLDKEYQDSKDEHFNELIYELTENENRS